MPRKQYEIDPKVAKARAKLGGESHRSPELQLAWERADQIKEANVSGISAIRLAEIYGIKVRAVYRILNS